MPISQMNKISPIESQPIPEIKTPPHERETSSTHEIPQVEFSQDIPVDKFRTKPQIKPQILNEPLVSGNSLADQKFKKIEAILEEDLGEVYFNLSPQKQHEFKVKGEEATIKILDLIARPKFQVKKIISLIRDWLKIIPGINVFFLEQVVKIKADKIINETTKNK